MKVTTFLLILFCLPCVATSTEDDFQESTRDEGIPLTEEGEQEDDEHLNEIEVNQRNGVDAFEGDIMMTAEQYEELKKEFEQTGQTLPQY